MTGREFHLLLSHMNDNAGGYDPALARQVFSAIQLIRDEIQKLWWLWEGVRIDPRYEDTRARIQIEICQWLAETSQVMAEIDEKLAACGFPDHFFLEWQFMHVLFHVLGVPTGMTTGQIRHYVRRAAERELA